MIYFDPTTGERKVPNDNRPKNDDERKDARHKGTLYGYMKAPKGRPTKGTPKPSSNETSTEATVPPPQSSVSAISTKPKINRGSYTKGGKTYERAMAVGIASLLLSGGKMAQAKAAIEEEFPGMYGGTIKRQTLHNRYLKKLTVLKKEEDHEIDDDLDMFDRRNAKNEVSLGLTNESDIQLIQSIAQARDDNNCGMSRKEAITFLSELKGVTWKTAENHYDHLIRSNKLTKLKNGGRVVSAQSTTTQRTAVTTEKLLRTYQTVSQGKLLSRFCKL